MNDPALRDSGIITRQEHRLGLFMLWFFFCGTLVAGGVFLFWLFRDEIQTAQKVKSQLSDGFMRDIKTLESQKSLSNEVASLSTQVTLLGNSLEEIKSSIGRTNEEIKIITNAYQTTNASVDAMGRLMLLKWLSNEYTEKAWDSVGSPKE